MFTSFWIQFTIFVFGKFTASFPLIWCRQLANLGSCYCKKTNWCQFFMRPDRFFFNPENCLVQLERTADCSGRSNRKEPKRLLVYFNEKNYYKNEPIAWFTRFILISTKRKWGDRPHFLLYRLEKVWRHFEFCIAMEPWTNRKNLLQFALSTTFHLSSPWCSSWVWFSPSNNVVTRSLPIRPGPPILYPVERHGYKVDAN